MTRTLCNIVDEALAAGRSCDLAGEVARVTTDVVYPSFDPVIVAIRQTPAGFRVSDEAGAVRSALVHGKEDAAIQAAVSAAASQFAVEVVGGSLEAVVPTVDWLRAAVLGVANASAHAAHAAVAQVVRERAEALHAKIYAQLARVVPEARIKASFEYRGESGRHWRAEYAVLGGDRPLFVRGVVPHHASVVHAYASFGDLPRQGPRALAVYEQELEPSDTALLRQVADVVTLAGVSRAAAPALH